MKLSDLDRVSRLASVRRNKLAALEALTRHRATPVDVEGHAIPLTPTMKLYAREELEVEVRKVEQELRSLGVTMPGSQRVEFDIRWPLILADL